MSDPAEITFVQTDDETESMYHARLFAERPVKLEALKQLRKLCDDISCCNIECLGVKCLLAYIDGNVEGRGMAGKGE